jgi:hypothetical protein
MWFETSDGLNWKLSADLKNKLWSGQFRGPKLNSDALEDPRSKMGNGMDIRKLLGGEWEKKKNVNMRT